MDPPKTYCHAVLSMGKDNVHKHYHDHEYGFPINSDNELFARLILEINQAGLSWTTILKKKDNYYKAYDDFKISIVAEYKEQDVNRLLSDAGIIRNRLKIFAAIYNAQQIITIQKNDGSFKKWLNKYHPLTKPE